MCNWSVTIMEQGIAEGMKQGIEQGMKQGIEKGIKKERIHAIERMIQANLTKEQIMSCGYTEDEFMEAESILYANA